MHRCPDCGEMVPESNVDCFRCAPPLKAIDEGDAAFLLSLHTPACAARHYPELGTFVCTCEFTP